LKEQWSRWSQWYLPEERPEDLRESPWYYILAQVTMSGIGIVSEKRGEPGEVIVQVVLKGEGCVGWVWEAKHQRRRRIYGAAGIPGILGGPALASLADGPRD